MSKYYVPTDTHSFSIIEETDFYRMIIGRHEIDEEDVEDFLDTTVEWLSSNPTKGILLDFAKVKSVCPSFVQQLHLNYEKIKARGLYVRFVNVNHGIGPYVDASNITIVVTVDPDKPVLSAKAILADLAENLTDHQLMKKYALSPKGLQSMFGKLVRKGLVTEETLAARSAIDDPQRPQGRAASESRKKLVDASQVLKDIEQEIPDTMLMRKYKLSPKGLKSLFVKLRRSGLITNQTLARRKMLRLTLNSSQDHTITSTGCTSIKKEE